MISKFSHTHNFFMMTSSIQKFFGGKLRSLEEKFSPPPAPPLDETLPNAPPSKLAELVKINSGLSECYGY